MQMLRDVNQRALIGVPTGIFADVRQAVISAASSPITSSTASSANSSKRFSVNLELAFQTEKSTAVPASLWR
ncbi:MAG: hypothetical protein U0694_26965 [Anaerolineae bacterium]